MVGRFGQALVPLLPSRIFPSESLRLAVERMIACLLSRFHVGVFQDCQDLAQNRVAWTKHMYGNALDGCLCECIRDPQPKNGRLWKALVLNLLEGRDNPGWDKLFHGPRRKSLVYERLEFMCRQKESAYRWDKERDHGTKPLENSGHYPP